MEKEKITAVTPLNPIVSNGINREADGFEYNKHAGQMRCPACLFLSVRKARTGKKTQNQRWTYYFRIERCQTCPLREGCYKSGAKSKTYSITIKSDIHQRAIDYQKKMNSNRRKSNVIKLKRKTQN